MIARWGGRAAMMAVTGAVLAGVVAGCSSPPVVARGSVSSCFAFGEAAISHRVTVTALPPACRGLSHAEVNEAMSRALHAAVAGVSGKVRQRELIGRDSRYVSALFSAVPAASQPAVAATPVVPPSTSQPSTSQPSTGPPSQVALSLAALATWLVTVGLGASMMARWIIRARPGRGAARNFAHMGLATASLGTWIGYLATGVVGVAWAACGLLLATASLGMTLVFLAPARDPGDAGDLAAHRDTSTTRGTSGGRPPPALLVGVHIAAACATILLATLTAAGAA